jgi:hypothetical protein
MSRNGIFESHPEEGDPEGVVHGRGFKRMSRTDKIIWFPAKRYGFGWDCPAHGRDGW